MSHYYKTDNNLKSNKQKVKYQINGIDFTMTTDNGVFSKDGIDYATKFLLEEIELKSEGRALDLGCGYGVVGAFVKKSNPALIVDMVDVNERALELAKENTKDLGVSVFLSDVYSNITELYDMIIVNPPIRAGKVVVHDMLKGSHNHLSENGELWFVMNKQHGLESALKALAALFDNAEIINKKKGFSVVKCIKSLPKQK